MKYNDTKTSKFISLILRHKPEAINKKLRHDGYMLINDLIEGMNNKGYEVTNLKEFEDNLHYIRYKIIKTPNMTLDLI